jgi:hypothetical protein
MMRAFYAGQGGSMDVPSNRVLRVSLRAALALLASAAVLVGGFAFVSRDFGFVAATVLSLILAAPLVVAARLWLRRTPIVDGREFALFMVLFFAASAACTFLIWSWYDSGLDDRYLEDVQWSRFENEFRRDPAFQYLTTEWNKKSRYYLVGKVASETDLDRLRMLAEKHQVRWPLDGPWAHSKSLTVLGHMESP